MQAYGEFYKVTSLLAVNELSVIAAGSLLEVFSEREGFSFPVGRVMNLFLYPVNFREYIEAKNPPLAEKLLNMDLVKDR